MGWDEEVRWMGWEGALNGMLWECALSGWDGKSLGSLCTAHERAKVCCMACRGAVELLRGFCWPGWDDKFW